MELKLFFFKNENINKNRTRRSTYFLFVIFNEFVIFQLYTSNRCNDTMQVNVIFAVYLT